MYKVRFLLATFGRGEWSDRARSNEAIGHLLQALYLIDCDFLRHYDVPRLYDSGVRYQREPIGREDWQDIPTTLDRRLGDCEDLATWRAAESTVRDNKPARPVFKYRLDETSGAALYHIQVEHIGGAIEDPSRQLGM